MDAGAGAVDGGRFVATLNAVEALWPSTDGGVMYGDGGWRGVVTFAAVSAGADQWQVSWALSHDAGAAVLGAELRNSVGGTNGGLLGAGQLSTSSAATATGLLTLTTAQLDELRRGRAYVSMPATGLPEGLFRGQLAQAFPVETVLTYVFDPIEGFPHPGSGGGATFLNLTSFTARYEAQWTPDVVATSVHIHRPDAGVILSMALYPDAGGARGTFSVIAISECQTSPCYTDIHTADAGAPGKALLRSR